MSVNPSNREVTNFFLPYMKKTLYAHIKFKKRTEGNYNLLVFKVTVGDTQDGFVDGPKTLSFDITDWSTEQIDRLINGTPNTITLAPDPEKKPEGKWGHQLVTCDYYIPCIITGLDEFINHPEIELLAKSVRIEHFFCNEKNVFRKWNVLLHDLVQVEAEDDVRRSLSRF